MGILARFADKHPLAKALVRVFVGDINRKITTSIPTASLERAGTTIPADASQHSAGASTVVVAEPVRTGFFAKAGSMGKALVATGMAWLTSEVASGAIDLGSMPHWLQVTLSVALTLYATWRTPNLKPA